MTLERSTVSITEPETGSIMEEKVMRRFSKKRGFELTVNLRLIKDLKLFHGFDVEAEIESVLEDLDQAADEREARNEKNHG